MQVAKEIELPSDSQNAQNYIKSSALIYKKNTIKRTDKFGDQRDDSDLKQQIPEIDLRQENGRNPDHRRTKEAICASREREYSQMRREGQSKSAS